MRLMPRALTPGILYVSEEFGVAMHMCACGCGSKVTTPLDATEWALEETENALVEWGREQARRDYLSESSKASEEAAALARQRYEAGATDFLNVLDAERVLLEGQNQLAASETRAATALVAVYKALGAGWEVENSK